MTRLILEFQLEKPEIPLEYDRLMVSFLKAAFVCLVSSWRKILGRYHTFAGQPFYHVFFRCGYGGDDSVV